MKIKHSRVIIFSFALLAVASVLFVFAENSEAAFTYQPMERIPGFEDETKSTTPDLKAWIESTYKFAMWVVGICALFMITIGGFTYMTSAGNTSKAGTGKQIITDAIIGLILALVAVLLFTVINPNITKVNLTINPASTSTSTTNKTTTKTTTAAANCTGTVPSNSTSCTSTNPTTSTAISLVSACANAACTYRCNDNYTLSGGQCVRTTTEATTCTQSGVDLCQGSSCNQSACTQYSSAISSAASQISISGINASSLISSIMRNESSCRISATSDAGACGLMQLLPSTANTFKAQCGVSANIDCAWLTDLSNAEESVCIGAKYLASLASGSCGTSVRNIAAGYNGGSGACGSSANCSGETSCAGGAVKRWECLYDNDAHTQCNDGYNETRTYATRVMACYNG